MNAKKKTCKLLDATHAFHVIEIYQMKIMREHRFVSIRKLILKRMKCVDILNDAATSRQLHTKQCPLKRVSINVKFNISFWLDEKEEKTKRSRKITVDIDALQEMFVNKNESIDDWRFNDRETEQKTNNTWVKHAVDNDGQNEAHAYIILFSTRLFLYK